MRSKSRSIMDRVPFVSILVVNYNGKKHFDEFFNSMFNLEYPKTRYEIVVVDNGSSDGSVEYLVDKYSEYIKGRRFPKIKIIKLNKNYGFAEGNNIGVNYCDGEFIALINNDTVVDKYWLSELIKHAVKDPNAIYGSKMLWYIKKDYIVYHGGVYLAWGWPLHLKGFEKNSDDQTEQILSVYADGCGMLISKSLFLKLGGFDKSYFAYAEDYELSWKAWLQGYRVYFIPTAKFYHKVSSTLGRISPNYIYLLWRNQLRNIIKFVELHNLLIMLPLFILHTIATYLILLVEGHPLTIIPMIKAYLKVLSELPTLIEIRREIQSRRVVRDRDLKKLGLILSFRESIMKSLDLLRKRKKFWEVVNGED